METPVDGSPTLAAPADPPDFDSYPMRARVSAATPIRHGVEVRWDDGTVSIHHRFWLRENAPDPETTHPVTREQALQLIDIPEDLEALATGPDSAGGLRVAWSDGTESRYHPGWLYAHGAGAASHDIHALPPRQIWPTDGSMTIATFDGPAALEDPEVGAAWTEALHGEGAAVLTGLPLEETTILTVPEAIGPLRETNFGKVFDVCSRPNADSNAFTAMTLPVHSDLATREYVPGLQFLHCLANEAAGGDSILADGFAIAEALRAEAPEAFETLSTVPLIFANKATNTDYRFETPMIRLNNAGEPDEIRWSPWLRAPLRAPFATVERVYAALRRIFRLAEEPRFRIRLRLRPGDLLGFDNRRILHGRTGFDPATGARHLRGCYVEREDLLSKIRIQARSRRHAAQSRSITTGT